MKYTYLFLLCLFPFFAIAQNSLITDNYLTTTTFNSTTGIPDYAPAGSTTIQNHPLKIAKNAIKIHSIFFVGSVALSYERSLTQKVSFEIGGGYIYSNLIVLATYDYGTTKGFLVRGGVKYILGTDKNENSQILSGFYLMPELFYTSYSTKDGYQKLGITEDFSSFTLTINAGYQYVFSNSLLINFFVGSGVGKSLGDYNNGYYFSHILIGNDLSFAFTTGFKLGYAF